MAGNRLERDIAIIGGGGAEVAAALEAGEAGATMVLLEQDDKLGGTAATSGGGCFIVGTPLQGSPGSSTPRRITRSSSFPWRGRISAASRPTCAAAC